YKSKYAENTIAAFQGAIDAGAKCIETDVQLSGDGTVMINHDPRTGRNYDKDLVIGESTLEELKQLKNLQDPALRLLTFKEFLEWAVEQPEETKIMLDIKANNSIMVLAVMQRIMLEVKGDLAYWRRKLIFGFWTLEFYEYAYNAGFIYGFEVINITFSPTIAKRFIEYSLTLPKEFQLRAISLILVATYASEFKQLHEELMIPNGLDLYLWTLNTQADFDLGYRLDCKSFITDDPIAAQ
ncbi:phosphatidylglycerol phospholipase, partial [Cyberlindnera jadinii NRRL Y-1542]